MDPNPRDTTPVTPRTSSHEPDDSFSGDQSSPTQIRYRTMAWLIAAAAIAYLCRNAVGVAESTIREDLRLSLTQSGWFMGMFFWTYALFSVPAGVLGKVWGSRLALTVFAITWSIATAMIGLAPAAVAGLGVLLSAQLCNGAAQSGLFPASFNSVSRWMPLGQRTTGCALIAVGMQIGAIAAASVTGHLLDPVGWRRIFLIYAVPGVVWASLFFFSFRNDPSQDTRVNEAELRVIRHRKEEAKDEDELPPTPWRAIARNRTMWMLCGQQIFRASGYMFFASWFPTFLQETRGVSKAVSGDLQATVLVLVIIGGLLGGVLTDWIWRRSGNLRLSRSGVGTTFLFMSGLLILGAYYATGLALSMLLICLGALAASIGGTGAVASTLDIGGKNAAPVFAIMNMVGNLAAAATPIYVGYIFEYTDNWNYVLFLFALIYFAGAGFWSLVNPDLKVEQP